MTHESKSDGDEIPASSRSWYWRLCEKASAQWRQMAHENCSMRHVFAAVSARRHQIIKIIKTSGVRARARGMYSHREIHMAIGESSIGEMSSKLSSASVSSWK